jgi:hypothetical protein
MGGYHPIRESVAIGIQDLTALWLLRALSDCCTTLDRIKKLASFIIWEASGQDLRVGKPELYPINLCVMEANKPHEYQEINRASVNGWLKDWRENVQNCFVQALDRMEIDREKRKRKSGPKTSPASRASDSKV